MIKRWTEAVRSLRFCKRKAAGEYIKKMKCRGEEKRFVKSLPDMLGHVFLGFFM